MVDLSLQLTDVRDYPMPQRDNTILEQKRVTFYLGKFGPFYEYFPIADFTEGAILGRVAMIRQQLEALHR